MLGEATHLFTYLLTPWCRVLLEKLTGLQLVKKFPAFHGTRMFITALKSVRQLSLSWASPIQSIYPHPTSWRTILILSTHLRLGLPSGLLPSGSPSKTISTPLSSSIVLHAQPMKLHTIYTYTIIRLLYFFPVYFRGKQIFQKSRSHLIILCTRRMTCRNFNTEDPQNIRLYGRKFYRPGNPTPGTLAFLVNLMTFPVV